MLHCERSKMNATAYLISFPVDFKLSRYRIIYSHHVVVVLQLGTQIGIGSGVLYRSTAATTQKAWLEIAQPQLTSLNDNLEAAQSTLVQSLVAIEPGLAFAIDTALWDLRGKINNLPLAHLLGGMHQNSIPITEQIFINEWSRSQTELEAILKRGTTRLKVKTGLSPAQDLALIHRVKTFVGPDVEIRIDANRAYPLNGSLTMYKEMATLGVLAVEEPIADKDWSALYRFRQETGLPVMLDESILTLTDLEQAIAAQAVDSLNIKLTRVGGVTAALAYRRLCDDAGVAVSLGCNEDIGPGMAAILHLAAACDNLYSTEGMGHLRLQTDIIAQPAPIVDGATLLPTGSGLGVTLQPDFPRSLNGRSHIFNLSTTASYIMQGYGQYVRNRQRATNLWHRLYNRIQQKSNPRR